MRSPVDYHLWNVKFAGETRLFLEGSQLHLNGKKHIIRRKTHWLLDIAWNDRRIANWITQNHHLAYWAAFNSAWYSAPQREHAQWQTNIEMCSWTWTYVAWKPTSSFQLKFISFIQQTREPLDPVDPQKNYKKWRDDKRAEISSALYRSYLLLL